MPIFKPIEEDEATGKVKEIFDEIKAQERLRTFQIFGSILLIAQKL